MEAAKPQVQIFGGLTMNNQNRNQNNKQNQSNQNSNQNKENR